MADVIHTELQREHKDPVVRSGSFSVSFTVYCPD